jgi:hypothetical protein
VLWSEALLIIAMLAVASVASMLGMYDVWIGLTLRRRVWLRRSLHAPAVRRLDDSLIAGRS